MKKKIVAFTLVIAMLAIAIVGGTLAYFTDFDEKTNVIAVGDVSAKLYESKYHRGANSSSYLFMTGQPEVLDDATIVADDATYHTDYLPNATLMPFDLKSEHRVQSMFEECTVAKNAYVQNTSTTNDCFVMVSYLIPADIAPYLDIFYVDTQFVAEDNEILDADARTLDNTDKSEPVFTYVFSSGANFVEQCGEDNFVEIDGGKYYVADFIYLERLTPGEFTQYSPISKITLIPTVTEETIEELGLAEDRQFDILVEAHVIQADGFYNALEAFDAYFEQEAAQQPQE